MAVANIPSILVPKILQEFRIFVQIIKNSHLQAILEITLSTRRQILLISMIHCEDDSSSYGSEKSLMHIILLRSLSVGCVAPARVSRGSCTVKTISNKHGSYESLE